MPRLKSLLLAIAFVSSCSGCTISREPCGIRIKFADWHLRNGTYRPFADVNSGTLGAPYGWYGTYGFGPGGGYGSGSGGAAGNGTGFYSPYRTGR
jgi:hypothetical protein